MTPHTYRVDVHREDRWWILHVPELDATRGLDECLGQARRYEDIGKEARDLITLVADVAPSTIDLDLHITVNDIDVSATAADIARDRATAAEAEARAIAASTAAAKKLRAAGLDLRDIGAVLGVSFQRVSQLVNG
jgi:hypothetical protein